MKICRTRMSSGSGIYLITSSLKGKRYIGSAVNLRVRKNTHWCTLEKGIHDNARIQNHVNKYGIDDLHFYIVEFCPANVLIEREQYWMDTLGPEFNICRKVVNSVLGLRWTIDEPRKGKAHPRFGKKLTKEHKKRNRETQLELWSDPCYKERLSDAHVGQVPWNKGLTGIYSEATKKKMGKRG